MLQLQNIECRFDNHTVLNGLNLEIQTGDFYAVMGTNGCGKSTLLRCISGILTPSAGNVLLEGHDLMKYSTRERAQKVALVQQQQDLSLPFTAYDIVMMGRFPYQKGTWGETAYDREVVADCMKQTDTWHLHNHFPTQMSGGEYQRVAIARAFAQEAPLLLLDEPLASLDIRHQLHIMHLLQERTSNPTKTTLLVVHDLNIAWHFCPNLLLLHEGGVAFQGPTREGLTPKRIETVFGVPAAVDNNGIRFLM